MLIAAGMPVPERELIHGYLLMRDASGEETKMSKSLGNVLDPFEVMDTVRDRRAALLLLPRGLVRPRRRRLHDDVRRALRVRAGQRLRQPREPHARDDRPIPRRRRARRRRRPRAGSPTSTASPPRSSDLLDHAEITQALERIWQRVRRLNRYVEERAPWQLAKDDGERARARRHAALARRGHPRGHGPAAPLHPGDGGQAARRARGGGPRAGVRGVRRARPAAARSAKLPPLFPKPQ